MGAGGGGGPRHFEGGGGSCLGANVQVLLNGVEALMVLTLLINFENRELIRAHQQGNKQLEDAGFVAS